MISCMATSILNRAHIIVTPCSHPGHTQATSLTLITNRESTTSLAPRLSGCTQHEHRDAPHLHLRGEDPLPSLAQLPLVSAHHPQNAGCRVWRRRAQVKPGQGEVSALPVHGKLQAASKVSRPLHSLDNSMARKTRLQHDSRFLGSWIP